MSSKKKSRELESGERIIFTEAMGGEGEILTVEEVTDSYGTIEIHVEELDFAVMATAEYEWVTIAPDIQTPLWPSTGHPEEFYRKQRELALFLFNMNNGPVASVTEWLDQWGDTDYYENYMRDAAEIIQLQPHLLTLPTREQMGLWDGPQQAVVSDPQA